MRAWIERQRGLVDFAVINLGRRWGRNLGLFLAYFIGGIVGRQIGGDTGMALFMPSAGQPAIAAVAGGVQAVLVWILAWSRIRAPERSEA